VIPIGDLVFANSSTLQVDGDSEKPIVISGCLYFEGETPGKIDVVVNLTKLAETSNGKVEVVIATIRNLSLCSSEMSLANFSVTDSSGGCATANNIAAKYDIPTTMPLPLHCYSLFTFLSG